MYKLLIVEDEKWEREGLRDFLQWNSMGIEVVGCACNGAEGKKMAIEYRPHIIITDIKMPILDGIQMSRDIRIFLPETYIIIISGYDDFELAKQTFDFRAFAYLLKPIQKKTLQETIENVLNKLNDEKVYQRERLTLENQWMDFTQKNLGYLIVDFLKHKEEIKYIDELPLLKRLKTYKRKVVAIFSLSLNRSKTMSEDSLNHETMQKILKAFNTMLGMRGIAISCNELLDEAIVCMDAPSTREKLGECLMGMVEELREKYGVYSIVGIGEGVDDLESVPLSYAQARKALGFRFLANYGELLFYSSIKDSHQKGRNLAEQLVEKVDVISKNIIDHIDKGDIHQGLSSLDEFLAILKQDPSGSKTLINRFIINVVNGLSIALSYNAENGEYVDMYDPKKYLVDYSRMDSLVHTKEHLTEFLSRAAANLKNKCCEDNVARMVLKIIEGKYWEELNLKRISEEIHLHPYYIGRIFKKYTGKHFNQFLNDYRIHKAKEILNSKNIKIADLAKEVGIPNLSYFCSLFKKEIGISPGEYMELMIRRHKSV